MTPFLKTKLTKSLIEHFGDDDRRIEHALRVTSWAERIMETEGGDREVILSVGLLHDTGIKPAEALEGSSSGKLQEKYGPPVVRSILEQIGLSEDKIVESCEIVANHHTPSGIPGANFAILWDADMLVNIRDDIKLTDPESTKRLIERSFRTETGKRLARREFVG